jgi:hypothetical protein
VIVALVIVAILALCVAVVVAAAVERGPTPGDVAMAYELAWDRLDFDALWSLSSPELRDDRSRHEFVAAKRAAYRDQPRLRSVVDHVEVVAVAMQGRRAAAVLTRLDLRDEPAVRNELRMQRRNGAWQVTRYTLRAETTATT